jgi:hypothetical protein
MVLSDIQLFGKKMIWNFRQGCEMENTHPLDATFSLADMVFCKSDWDYYRVCYQFTATPNNLYLLYIPINLRFGFKFSDRLNDEFIEIEREIWKKCGAVIKNTTLPDKRILTTPVYKNKNQQIMVNNLWNKKFPDIFKRWNFINENQLEYKIFNLK